MADRSCELNMPYPPAKGAGRNVPYANLLLENYAGNNGELTAVTQYFYQYFIVKPEYGELASSLECVSVTEMHHMELLGELIVSLGGNPLLRTWTRRGSVYWRGDNISPVQSIPRFLRGNINAEREAINLYRRRIGETEDENIKRLLERIILDEEHHIEIFEGWLKKFG